MLSLGPEFELVLPSLGCVILGFGALACGSANSAHEAGAVTTARESARSENQAPIVRTLELSGARRFSFRVDCERDRDCAIASIPLDCCGSVRELGVRAGEKGGLERRVEASTTFRATCECLASPTQLDDGSEAEVGARAAVRCEQNQCMTYSPSPRSSGAP